MEEDFVKQMFDYVNDSVGYHLGSADNLKGFMTFLAGMRSNITVANKVLAYGYNAYAADVHTKEEWESLGVRVTDENAVIHLLQHAPDSKYGYTDRVVYDISSTNATGIAYELFPNAGFFAERLLMYPPCPIKFSEKPLSNNRKSGYDPEKGVIEVTMGFRDEEQVCHGLLREFAHFYLYEKEMRGSTYGKGRNDAVGAEQKKVVYDRNKHGVEATAISFAVCTRYGINPPEIDVVNPPEIEPKDLLKVLDGLDYSVQKISGLVDEGGERQRRFFAQRTGGVSMENEGHQPRDSMQA